MSDLIVIEHRQKRVLTTSQLAESYGTDSKAISKNFTNNKERYAEGKHYFCLKGEELRAFRKVYELPSNINILYLWTEKGAWLHAKSLNTDEAWEAYELLVDEYYKAVENPPQISQEQLIKQFNLPANYKEALYQLAEYVDENEQLKQQIENDREKVVLANAITVSDEGLLIEAAAKYMRQNGVNIGRDRLFKWLRGQGYLVSRKGREWNMPTQRALNQGLMKIHCQLDYDSEGELRTNRQVVVTGKGLMYFINRILFENQLTLRLE